MNKELVRLSRFLSLVLRHKPETIGLSLDPNGWVEVDELIRAANRHGKNLTRGKLEKVVAENDKQRFAFSRDGTRIRARQGHSVAVDLNLEERQPPAVLYHGTTTRFADEIARHGLKSMKRHHVHLSRDAESARKVGARRGRPVVFEIAAGKMDREGFKFFLSENGVWLTEAVPSTYLQKTAL